MITIRKILGILLFLLLFPMNVISAQLKTEIATFAGGCFWCTQADFDKVAGVLSTTVGYMGGDFIDPTYEQVSEGGTGHYEVVQVQYDPNKVSYKQLLEVFWHNIDPTNPHGQFCDQGDQYGAVIFYYNDKQKELALQSKENIIQSGRFRNVYTQVLPAKSFYPAETYHQKYYQKNPLRYKFYRYQCGRDARLQELWST